jgi:hypothetical protein
VELCIGTSGGLFPVGKEADRRWEQGEDPSMLDPSIHIYETQKKMCVADLSDRRRWRQTGVRNGMRRSGLSQKAVSAILNGEPVRIVTLATFKRAMEI